MAKTREAIPRVVRDAVLKEFNHRCAKCAADRPQLHHIDEDPSNNDQLNIIPLCPNCHLVDQHDASNAIPQAKLRLFRRHKHKRILSPRFNSLFKRMAFLDQVEGGDASQLKKQGEELIDFVGQLQMGAFFGAKLEELLKYKNTLVGWVVGDEAAWRERQEQRRKDDQRYLAELAAARPQVEALVVELLDHQDWS